MHRRQKTARCPVLVWFISLLAFATVSAEPPSGSEPSSEVHLNASRTYSEQRAADQVIVLTGEILAEVALEGENKSRLRLRAQNAVLWTSRQKARAAKSPEAEIPEESDEIPFDELYAEGLVECEFGSERIHADVLYLDLRGENALALGATLVAQAKETATPIRIRAAKIRQLAGTLEAKQASATTCTFLHPHYQLAVRHFKLRTTERRGMVRFSQAVAWIEGIPILYFPTLLVPVGYPMPLKRVDYARSRRFGHTIKTLWAFDIHLPGFLAPKPGVPPEAPGAPEGAGGTPEGADGTPEGTPPPRRKRIDWGELSIEHDYMSRRGHGFAPGVEYEYANYEGFLATYLIHDFEGPDPNSPYEARFFPAETETRGRVHEFHRQALTDALRWDTEVYYLSDRNFLEEFFQGEFRDGRAEETYTYLRYQGDRTIARGLVKQRLNDFQTDTEFLPRVAWDHFYEPAIGRDLHLGGHFEVLHARQRFDDRLDLPAERLWRQDAEAEVGYPRSFGFLRTYSFVAGRLTYFDETLAGAHSRDRFVGTAGSQAYTRFGRIYGLQSPFLGLRGLRHFIGTELKYSNNVEATRPPSAFIPLDATEQLDTFHELSLEIRNTLETKNVEGIPHEFLNLGVQIDYYPHEARDTSRFKLQNALFPFSWVKLSPNADGRFPERHFSNLVWDLTLRPQGIFSVTGSGEIDTHGSFNDKAYVGTSLDADPVRLQLTSRFAKKLTHSYGAGISVELSEKWGVDVGGQYDFTQSRIIDYQYALRRNLHDFTLELSVLVDRGKLEQTFLVHLYPRGMSARKWRLYRENYQAEDTRTP